MMDLFLILVFFFVGIANCGSPTNSYAPGRIVCPESKLTRSSLEGLNPAEKTYIDQRYILAKQSLNQFLQGANLSDFDTDSFLNTSNPTIGLAFSGGGYRAMLSGAGELSALDSRIAVPSILSGILQSANYIVGLSGGNWLTGTIASNNLITIDQILALESLWNLQNSLFAYHGVWYILNNTLMWLGINLQVKLKWIGGFAVSITDIYARALSYQFLSDIENNGAAFCWSDITTLSSFQDSELPFPILAAVGRQPGTMVINFNSTVFEFTPYEIGSWDPSLRKFMNTKYLGSDVNDGIADGKCVNGFDNAGFLMGTSSSLFNEIILKLSNLCYPTFLKTIINSVILDPVGKLNVDIAHYEPNPFYKSENPDNAIAKSKTLYLADGGEDGQNVPLLPLVHRNVSVIFAFDNSADENGWPDGTSLVKTYERQFSLQGENVAFPYVPDQYTFRNLNLTSKPTFFGCDAKNLSSITDNIYDVPLIIYNANRPFSYWSNTSTYKLKYSNEEKQGMIANGYYVGSNMNGMFDDEFAACIGCAIIRREQERRGIEQTNQCKRCFETYCWDGTIYNGEPLGDNFSDDGLTDSAVFYNGINVEGINNGAADFV